MKPNKTILTIIVLSICTWIPTKAFSQAPDVQIKMCGPTGGTKILDAIKISLKCNLCCQGTEPYTYVPIYKCMPNKSTICGTDFLLSPPNTFNYGTCQTCINVTYMTGTVQNPVRIKIEFPSLGKYWIVGAYTNLDSDEFNGVEFNLSDIIEGSTEGLPL
ncbi:MAG: hypothetical protein ACKOXF_00470 [Chitinophagaceae bacterium]